MRGQASVAVQKSAAATIGRAPAGVLQRQCACGQHTQGEGECEQCAQERMTLQRKRNGMGGTTGVPPIVHEVLRSPGHPLDSHTRSFMEPRFGHDFSAVRVHADSRAAESARSVGALAFTAGRHVVFGAGTYAPHSSSGRCLLAHELTHVVQQGAQGALQEFAIGATDDRYEAEAERIAADVSRSQPVARTSGLNHLSVRSPVLQRAAIHSGNILDEGSCQHVACGSTWACEDPGGFECPAGTQNAFAKTKKKFRPLFACDIKCENNATCNDGANWISIPASRFAYSKCKETLTICANGKSTEAHLRDKSDVHQAWEVSHGVQDDLGVSPYSSFSGSIYGDAKDPGFAKDKHCVSAAPKSTTSSTKPTGTREVENKDAGTK